MKVNKQLMEKARFERKHISELTVAEFRQVMQECFIADRAMIEEQKARKSAFDNMILNGLSYEQAQKRLSQTIFGCQ